MGRRGALILFTLQKGSVAKLLGCGGAETKSAEGAGSKMPHICILKDGQWQEVEAWQAFLSQRIPPRKSPCTEK